MESARSLHGSWKFKLDEQNVGVNEKWYEQSFENTIDLPGSLQNQGYGNKISVGTPFVGGLHDRLWFLREEYKEFTDPEDTKIPFLSQPVRHYIGVAWYQKEIDIPAEWGNKQIELHLERPRWKTSVWVDSNYIGEYDSLCAGHRFDLGHLKEGKHTLTIQVDNRMIYPYRPDAHTVTDYAGNTWNGIVGKIELIPKALISFGDVSVFPNYKTKTAVVKLHIHNLSNQWVHGKLHIQQTINLNCSEPDKYPISHQEIDFDVELEMGENALEYSLLLGETASLWDEFNPALHQLEITLNDEGTHEVFDQKSLRFGLRNIRTKGKNFLLNGKKISFRGTHDAGFFPLTGYPSTDVDEWKQIMSICKQWGLNHIRYHSWCPPEAAFIAADELGIYLQVECGMWNYFIRGGVIEKQLHVETDRILKAFGNHASFLLFATGNEPHGDYGPCVRDWVAKYRKLDNRHLYCGQSGWFWPKEHEPVSDTDYYYTCSRGKARMRGIHGWFGKDYNEYMEDIEAPFLSHELGQHCAYPDFSIIDKFTGYLRPGNYEIFKHSLAKHGMAHKNKDFVQASGILQAAAYKEEVEANLRTKSYSGFSLLDLRDNLGQGTALVGLLDAFWEEKPYINPEQFTRFCAPVVPLARLKQSVYTTNETLCAEVEVACYDKEEIKDASIYWKVLDENGKVVLHDHFATQDLPTGGNTWIGKIEIELSELQTLLAYKLVVGIERTAIENDWKFWVYPEQTDDAAVKDIKVTKNFREAMQWVKQGEDVLFMPRSEHLNDHCPPVSKVPVFWNTQMGPKWSHSLGLWCEPRHPALAEFPTSHGMEWQWLDIIEDARAINMEGLPEQLEPFIWPIDDWNRNYKLALAFECKVGKGKLIICSANLDQNGKNRPAAKQLFYSLMKYMDSDSFEPQVEVTEKELQSFLFDTTIMRKMGAQVKVVAGDQMENEQNPITNLIDGDPNTYWLAGGPDKESYPFIIEFEIDQPVLVKGIHVMPRQNHRDAEGAVKTYEIYTSLDDKEWTLAAKGEFNASFDLQTVTFKQAFKLKKLRLHLIEGFGAEDLFQWIRNKGFQSIRSTYQDKYASLAEVSFICDQAYTFEHADEIQIQYENVATASEEMY